MCLGSQILAAVLGANVVPSDTIELGWHQVHLAPEARNDPLFAKFPASFTPFHWHGDNYDLPSNSIPLGSTSRTSVQGFAYDARAYGLLFHLEVTVSQVAAMTNAFPADVARARLTQERLLAETPDQLAELAEVSLKFFRGWVNLI